MFNFNKKNRIGANPSPTFEKPEFPKRESQLPLPQNKVPMPECKTFIESKVILEKKIRFNNRDWLIKINGNEFEVFLYDSNGEIDKNYIFRGWESGKTLIDQCRNIILKANKCIFPIDELDDFQKWNGNMDKELNNDGLVFIQGIDTEELNYMNELEVLSKIESKTFNEELRIKWIQDYFINKLMTSLKRS